MAGNTKGWTSRTAIDLTGVSKGPPPPMNDGIYKASVVKAEPQETKKGKAAFVCDLKATECLTGQSLEGVSPMLRFETVSEDAPFRLKQLCESAQIDPPTTWGFDDITEFCKSLVGCEAIVKAKQSTYNGKTNAKVDAYLTQAEADEEIAAAAGKPAEAPTNRRRPRGEAPAAE